MGRGTRREYVEHPRAKVIRASLRTAGDTIPEPTREAVYGKSQQPPSILVESAEGVTTFAGFGDDEVATRNLKKKVEQLAKLYPLPEPTVVTVSRHPGNGRSSGNRAPEAARDAE